MNTIKNVFLVTLAFFSVTGMFSMEFEDFDYDLYAHDQQEDNGPSDDQRREALYALVASNQKLETDDLERDLDILQQHIVSLRAQEARCKGLFAQGIKPAGYPFGRFTCLLGAVVGAGVSGVTGYLAYNSGLGSFSKNYKKFGIAGGVGLSGVVFSGLCLKAHVLLVRATEKNNHLVEIKVNKIRKEIALDAAIIDALINGAQIFDYE